ncbi:MAG: hypothetical protein ABR530_02820 [Pyrinomonadaceae bacterium]
MKRLLLDENLPKQLKRHFSPDFDVTSVPDLGWQSKKNGELLTGMVDEGIDYLITADRNLRFPPDRHHCDQINGYPFQTVGSFVPQIEAAIVGAKDLEKFIEIELIDE